MEYLKMGLRELKDHIRIIEENLKSDVRYFSPNHELEIYLLEYYNSFSYELIETPLHRMYFALAQKYKKRNQPDKVLKYLKKAQYYNPTDVELFIAIAKEYYYREELEEMRDTLQRMHVYLYTKNDIASYYFLSDAYYLATYQPEVAEALAMYGNLFVESKQAQIDLEYIEKSVGRKRKNATIKDLQVYLTEKQIPIQPCNETLGILYKVALMAKAQKETGYAKQLLQALYQLTMDEEVGNILMELG